ncbi:MAG TPA: 30S ribosomal protein S3 [Candidatus Thermoplasmatota archaeon]|nr:30S ribosomal protein S3 [Candidatus Thermoplasmatota archaeon]
MAVERKLIREHKKRVAVREYLHRETERAGFGGAEISRTPMGTRIHLVTERPGFVIGRRGETIKKLTQNLHERFGLDNPQIEVAEAADPSLNPQIMAQKLAEALERGWHFRRAGHSTLRRIMDAGAKGVLITIAGKLTGGRKRTEKFLEGHIKWCGDTALQHMEVGYATAKKKLGIIGCTVAIMNKDARLPDEVEIHGGMKGGQQAAPTPATDGPREQAPGITREGRGHEKKGQVAGLTTGMYGAGPQNQPMVQRAPAPAPAASAPASPGAKLEGNVGDLPGIGPKKAEALKTAGFETLADLDEAPLDDIAAVEGIGPKLAMKIKDELKKLRK